MTPERSFEADWKSRPNFFSLELGDVVYASICATKHCVSEISKKTPTVSRVPVVPTYVRLLEGLPEIIPPDPRGMWWYG